MTYQTVADDHINTDPCTIILLLLPTVVRGTTPVRTTRVVDHHRHRCRRHRLSPPLSVVCISIMILLRATSHSQCYRRHFFPANDGHPGFQTTAILRSAAPPHTTINSGAIAGSTTNHTTPSTCIPQLTYISTSRLVPTTIAYSFVCRYGAQRFISATRPLPLTVYRDDWCSLSQLRFDLIVT